MATAALTIAAIAAPTSSDPAHRATIVIDDSAPIATFDPLTALGSTIDGHAEGSTAKIFTPANVAAMRSANFHAISYRLRTELSVDAWHWNARGTWSDAEHAQGYWTSSDDTTGGAIEVSYGYRLPRRGSTIDQANEASYSRIDDGDTASFWKSNPYLDHRFSSEPDSAHPQWIVIDLGAPASVNAIRISWGAPYATRYEVQYWRGEEPQDADEDPDGGWRTFPRGSVSSAHGGDALMRLAESPVRSRWFRVLMRESSRTALAGSRDVRDSLGFAVRELSLGTIDDAGALQDVIRHAPRATRQTKMYVSSTDPWHRASDRDPDVEQPGIDAVFASGITRGLPTLLPVGVLYDTPENGAALVRYVRARGYPVQLELGEEPDGQYASPRDFAALYLQVADALHRVDRSLALGGPSFQSAGTDVMMTWKSREDDDPWLTQFVDALRARGRLGDFTFFSFEWYPYDDVCSPTAPRLDSLGGKLESAMEKFRADGLPHDVSIVISEYGYSAFSGAPEVTRAAALLDVESVARFLAAGGSRAFFYGTEPTSLDRASRCDSWGNNALFLADEDRRIRQPTAAFHAARLMTTDWADSAGGTHALFSARSSAAPVSAYPLRRPDGRWSVMLVNRDSLHEWSATLRTRNGRPLDGPFTIARLGPAEYVWHPARAAGRADPDQPPSRREAANGSAAIGLPPYSVTVIRQHAP